MATVNEIVSGLTATARGALSTAREQASRIGAAFTGNSNATFNFTPSKPNLQAPPQFSDLLVGDSSPQQITWLNGEVEKFIDSYFPELSACLRTKPEEWLCSILSGDQDGISNTVFEVIWHRGRDRAYRASASDRETLMALFSERGFSVPPGALLQAQLEVEQGAGQAVADINREVMQRAAEIKLDLLKFAEQQAIQLKLGIMQSLRDFYSAWISLPDKDLERARIQAQAQASLYGALSSYYDVELGFEQLRLRAAEARAGIALDRDRIRVSGNDGGRNAAIGAAVRGFTDVAAAASNAGGALVAEISNGGGA